MILCGVAITGFTVTVTCDIVTRLLGRPWLWLQEVTMTFFIYGVLIGTAAATRPNDHIHLSIIAQSPSRAQPTAPEALSPPVGLPGALFLVSFVLLHLHAC